MIVPFIAGIGLVLTLVVPWLIAEVRTSISKPPETKVMFSWDMIERFSDMRQTSFAVMMIASWAIGVATIIISFAAKGVPRAVSYAVCGAVGLIFVLVTVFSGKGPSTMGTPTGGEVALTIFEWLFLLTLIVITNVRLRIATGLPVRVIQIVAASGLLLMEVIALIVHLTGGSSAWKAMSRMGDHETLMKIMLIIATVLLIGGGVLILLQGIQNLARAVATAGLWLIYGAIGGYYIFNGIFFPLAAEQTGMMLTFLNIGLMFGGIYVVLCSGAIQTLTALMQQAAAGGPALAGAGGGVHRAHREADDDVEAKFERLERLLEHGHITEEEYHRKRQELIEQM